MCPTCPTAIAIAIANKAHTLLSAVNELTGEHALGGNKGLLILLVAVRVSKDDFCERGPTTGVMDDGLDDSPNVPVSVFA